MTASKLYVSVNHVVLCNPPGFYDKKDSLFTKVWTHQVFYFSQSVQYLANTFSERLLFKRLRYVITKKKLTT